MWKLIFGLLVLVFSWPALAQEPRQLAPIVFQELKLIPGTNGLQSPGILLAKLGDRFSELGWPKFTKPPSNTAYTGFTCNYGLHMLGRTEFSNNNWGMNTFLLPFINRFLPGGYSEARSDVRVQYLCALEIWILFDGDYLDGRREIVRSHGGDAATFESKPYQGYETNAYINSAGHYSSGAIYNSNPQELQERSLINDAVVNVTQNLEANLSRGGYVFQSWNVQQSAPSQIIPIGGRLESVPPTISPVTNNYGSNGPQVWTHPYYFKAGELDRFKNCQKVRVWARTIKGRGNWLKGEEIDGSEIKFFSNRAEFPRTTPEAAEEQLEFVPK